ncbi:prolyl 3-hydroxylase 3 isoform X2 [Ornithorhynchus anatinus]|uniref:prolyl 3-hydroxylase 3 isoform X2 n=1 Tax=Ornithorhynchus anatinus TaxID=9258 RepID=UPI0010A786FB|nr:prolyl 3-hydroxylase 3 isoform X2 [Ornithorhynchus anatinus]
MRGLGPALGLLLLLLGSSSSSSPSSRPVLPAPPPPGPVPPAPADLLYADGLRAYAAGAWGRAVALLRGALRSRAQRRRVRRACGKRCGDGDAGAEPGTRLPPAPGWTPGPGPWEPLLLRAALARAECLRHCTARGLGPGAAGRHRTGRALRLAFRRREPYNYLQRAYYQLKKLDLAVAAAHTFFVANPRHLQMREDMAKYRRMAGVRPTSFRDLESPPHWAAYDAALELLRRGELGSGLERLEEALRESLDQAESCRADCQRPQDELDTGDVPEAAGDGREEEATQGGLYEAIAEHWVQVLRCRQRCSVDTATRPGRTSPVPDFVPDLLRRLQEAHAQGNLSRAVENALSFLLFYPEDEAVLKTVDLYREQLGGDGADARPREDIRRLVQRSLWEKQLLFYAMEHLGTTFQDPDPWTPKELIPETLRERLREDQEKTEKPPQAPEPEAQADWRDVLRLEGVTLVQDAGQLNGSERVVLDGLLAPAECRVLLQLAQDAAGVGDGYRGRRSPHTPHERFEGLTVLRAAQLAEAGTTGRRGPRLLLTASERVRALTEAYFSPGFPLHLSFTHLVCRSAIKGEQEQRMDLSHPVHADNCVLDPESGECWREPPAYTYRDYSGLLYLNEDFQGGDLFFTEPDALTVTAQVRPRCGRLVAFSSGVENPHGVWAVTRGRRCALALWHTRAPEYTEQERAEAEELLSRLEQRQGEGSAEEGADSPPEPPEAPRRGRRVREEL